MVQTALMRERPDDLSGYARLVWIALKSRADAVGICFPTVATIGADTNWPRRTVERALAELVGKGLLVREVHGAGRPNRYRVLPLGRAPPGTNGAVESRPPGGNGPSRSGVDPPLSRLPGGIEGTNPASFAANPASFESNPAKDGAGIPPNRPANKIQENKTQREQDPPTRGNIVPNTESGAPLARRAGALPPVSIDDSPEAGRLAVVGALVDRCGRPSNDVEKGRYRRAAGQLEQAGADAAEVGRLADAYAARWPHLALTPMALANNVSTLRRPAPAGAFVGPRRQSLRDKLALLDDEGDQ